MGTPNQRQWTWAYFLLFLLLVTPTMQCGPGRGASGGRRPPRKRTPLVFKQHVPNVSENNLGASGPTSDEGPIMRGDSRFKKELLVNTNPDIVFKDEEGNEDDRLMTQRCKDKVNTLAISVMNQWPSVKLRITESWDEKRDTMPIMHAPDSLHYEGRAVDITTSDRDRTKYGMLARLAVEAGFDWVYYKSRGHIHCSVKSDSSIAVKTGGCFPGVALATLPGGHTAPLSSLSPGDQVLTRNSQGHLVFDKVIAFFHQNPNGSVYYLRIVTDSGQRLVITPDHLLYASRSNSTGKIQAPIFAADVEIGYFLHTVGSRPGEWKISRVVDISGGDESGLYAPLTKHGTIVINDVIASCYAVINSHDIAHASLKPFIWVASMVDSFRTAIFGDFRSAPTMQQAVHWYADFLYGVATVVLPSDYLYSLP